MYQIIFPALTALFGWKLYKGFTQGHISMRTFDADVTESPISYWIGMVLTGIMTLAGVIMSFILIFA